MNQKRETPDEFDFDFGNIFGVAPAPGTAAVNDSTKPEVAAGTGHEQPQERVVPDDLRNNTRVVLAQASIAAERASHAMQEREHHGNDYTPSRRRRV